jgi:NADPH:quinone reductase-like Zn-dependent oxidoreductase
MKAVVYHDFGSADCLTVEEIDKPSPGDGEVLVATRAAGVNMLDWYFVRGGPFVLRLALGVRKQKRLGVDVAGMVEAVGPNVSRFKPGDEVFGSARGAFAEYACTPETALAIKPRNASFEQAASIAVAGVTALQGLRDHGRLRPGHKVLINGASGGIGTFAVQIAKALGAEVTAVCSTRNTQLLRSIGADHVIDYQREDFTKGVARYDIILDIVTNHTWRARSRMRTPTGRYVLAGGDPLLGIRLFFLSRFTGRGLITYVTHRSLDDLTTIRELIESGKVTPVIDRTYLLEETPEAVRYVAAGHTRGKVVIAIGAEERGRVAASAGRPVSPTPQRAM